jgi:hypothetical protein
VVTRQTSCSALGPLVRWWLVISLRLDTVLPVGGGVSEAACKGVWGFMEEAERQFKYQHRAY